MKRLLIWSDLHNEFWKELPARPEGIGEIDAVLLAGDVSAEGQTLECLIRIWDMFRVPVLAVRGNHDFYDLDLRKTPAREEVFLAQARAEGVDIHILDRHTFMLDDLRILGATLWTDLDLYPGQHREIRDIVKRGLNDFVRIKVGPVNTMDTGDWLDAHHKDRSWLIEQLAIPHSGPTLVMTHHLPVREVIHPSREIGRHLKKMRNAGYASDMWPELKAYDIQTWIFGHTHHDRDIILQGEQGAVRFLANPRGYPGEGCSFNPAFVIEVPARDLPPNFPNQTDEEFPCL